MRDIKFRAFNGMNMFEVSDIDFLKSKIGEMFRKSLRNEYDTDEVFLMQYTGLKDKNGKEIYEGDICTAEEMFFPLTGTRAGIVKYYDGSYLLEDFDGKDGEFLFSETAETTVIGNIYESPELLHDPN